MARAAGLAPLLAACAALTACEDGPGEGQGRVSAGEAKALEEAAEMLEDRQLPEDALPDEANPTATARPETGEAGPS
jgi:hypothetical protein